MADDTYVDPRTGALTLPTGVGGAQLSYMATEFGTMVWDYDANGFLVTQTHTLAGVVRKVTFTNNAAGKPLTSTGWVEQ